MREPLPPAAALAETNTAFAMTPSTPSQFSSAHGGARSGPSTVVFPWQQMLDALEAVAGPKVRARVKFQRDSAIAGIVANWPSGASSARANKLGLTPHTNFAEIIRQYIADCAAAPNADQTLKGLSK